MEISSSPVQKFEQLWLAFGGKHGLLPELALDAVLARYQKDEVGCMPRIVELVCTGSATTAESAVAVAALRLAPLTAQQVGQVKAALDHWWLRTLMLPSGDPATVVETLGILAGFEAPMHRWLQVWLESFDGPAAHHFVEAVLASEAAPANGWIGKQDEWLQFRAWCRAEPTVMGFTLIGAVHIEPEKVTAVMDALI